MVDETASTLRQTADQQGKSPPFEEATTLCESEATLPGSVPSEEGDTRDGTLSPAKASPTEDSAQKEESVKSSKAYAAIRSRLRGKTPPKPATDDGLPFGSSKAGSDKPSGWRDRLSGFVLGPKFEVTFAALILMNTVVMAFQVQYRGLQTGAQMEYPGIDTEHEIWPGATDGFLVLEWIFGLLFSIEIILKWAAIDIQFFCDLWNILDLVVVVAWAIDTAGQGILPIDPMLLRLLRLVKLLRMLRLIRTIQGFDSLYVMITAIKGSIAALMWSIALLMIVEMMISLFLSTMVESYITDPVNPIERRIRVYTYYGTFTRSSLTLFELTLANWPPAARTLTENVGEGWIFFVLIFQAVIGFSVIKVIMGVFLQVTFHVAANDDVIMMNQKERAIKTHTAKMSLLFAAADEDGNGRLDEDEFQNVIEDPTIVSWLSAMGFEAAFFNGREVYKLLCAPGQSDLSAEELIRGVSKLKGPATSLNLALMQHENKATKEVIKKITQTLQELQASVGLGDPPAGSKDSTKDEEEEEKKEEEDHGGRPGRASVSDMMFSKNKHQIGEIDEDASAFQKARHKYVEFVMGFQFETTFAALIAANTVIMAAQVQYRGLQNGYELNLAAEAAISANNATDLTYPPCPLTAAEAWPGATEAFAGLEYFFGVVFTIEIVMKVGAQLHLFVKDYWNILDTVIVGFWYFETLSGSAALPLDPMLLRLFRLVRLLRMVRLVRFFEKFDALYLMMTSIKGSLAALTWSSILLLVVQMMLALFMATILEGYLIADEAEGDKHKVYEYYGTFSRAMLTMFEITLGNWIPVTRVMMKNVTEAYVIFALIHKFIIGFAVVMVITGVFIQETMKVAQTDNTIMLKQRERASSMHVKKMSALFAVADADGSGRLDADEFASVCADPAVKVWISAMGLDVSNAHTVFDQLTEQLGVEDLSAEELVIGVSRLKGPARNMDMSILRNENLELRKIVQDLKEQVKSLGEHYSKET